MMMIPTLRHLCLGTLIYWCALSCVAVAQSEDEKTLMLPSRVTLAGIVLDSDGEPLAEVWIDHTGLPIENARTDLQGRFVLQTRAPAVVFRKDGFESKYLRVTQNRNLLITLGPASRMKECEAFLKCVPLKGFMASFCLPKVPKVHVGKQGNDIDYGQRWFWVRTQSGKSGIQHAGGGMWGSGRPFDKDVWSARDYLERSYCDRDGFLIIDARGRSTGEKYWRVLGHVFETASYRDVAEQDTPLLDRVLDGACVQAKRFDLPPLR
jgi:hypothetical protein